MRLIRTPRRLIPSRRWLSGAALAFGGYLFLSVPLFTAVVTTLEFLKTDLTLTPWGFLLAALWLLIVYPRMLLFSHLTTYLLASGFGIGLALVALIWGRPRWGTRVLLILMVLAILAFPWLQDYRPAVVAAPGYEMRWLTQPGRLESVVKSAQAAAEIRPCGYTLLGWSADGVLYYQETCGRSIQIWRYDPEQADPPQAADEVPTELFKDVPRVPVLNLVRALDVRPLEEEPNARRVALQQPYLASPDGRWVAVVVRHLYGPEDVLVLAVEGEGGE